MKYILPIVLWIFGGTCIVWMIKRRIRPRAKMSQEHFCLSAAERMMQEFPRLKLLQIGTLYLEVDAGTGPFKIQLDNAYQAALCEPKSTSRQIDLAIRAALEAGNLGRLHPLEQVRNRILPILKPMRFVDASPRLLGEQTSLYWEPLGNDVAVCYQLGDPLNPTYLGSEQVEAWDIPTSELREIAVANLAARTDWNRLRRPRDPEPLWAAFELNDGLDAARILLPDLQEQLGKILGGSFAVAVPHRDALFACVRSQKLVDMLQGYFDEEKTTPGNRLTERFFLVTDQGITEYAEVE